MKEKRRLERVRIALHNDYTTSAGCITVQASGMTEDISLGGLSARMSRVVKRGNTILLELVSPYKKKLSVLGKVVWTRPADPREKGAARPEHSSMGHICGLKFLWVSSPLLLKTCIEFGRHI